MANIFDTVQAPKVGSNWFNLSHDRKFSCDMGKLVPVLCAETLPGEKWKIRHEAMIRFAPLIAPVMHRFRVYFHTFFVPNRILWDNFYDWLFGVKNAAFPVISLGSSPTQPGTLADYLGFPTVTVTQNNINALPFAAYQAIYSEFYRDQNLIPEVDYKLKDGFNANTVFRDLRTRAWRKDYFTSALPFAQRGADVMIPLSGELQVTGNLGVPIEGAAGNVTYDNISGYLNDGGGARIYIDKGLKTESLEDAQLPTVREFRQVLKLQEWLERNARAGVRAVEGLWAHFNVKSKDERLQRPEYIMGSSQPVVVSEVLQTAEGDSDPVGNMAGHAISVNGSRRKTYFTPEHGYMITLMSVMPEPAYQQGVPRHFLKGGWLDRFSYAWPTFQHIGEQEILNSEIFVDHLNPEDTFGYTPRYAEYKYIPSSVHGDFKTTLNHWHAGRIFEPDPQLNKQFVECNPTKRIFAVQEGHVIWSQVMNDIKVRRPLARFSNPRL